MADFYSNMLPYAQQASAGTGLPVSVILAQWSLETGHGTSLAGTNNYAGITNGGVSQGFANYGTIGDFVNGWIKTIKNGYYQGVLNTAQVGTPEQTAQALGASPWDADHYYISYPGEKLVNLINSDNLKQYDTAAAASVPFGPSGPPAGTSTGGSKDAGKKSLLDSYKEAWGNGFTNLTGIDPQKMILLAALALMAALIAVAGFTNLVKD